MDDFGFWLFVAFWVWLIWLVVKRYRRKNTSSQQTPATRASPPRKNWRAPLVTPATFPPVDQPMSTADAKRMLRELTLKVTPRAKAQDLAAELEEFAESLRTETEALQWDLESAREDERNYAENAKQIKQKLAEARAALGEKEPPQNAQETVERLEEELEDALRNLADSKEEQQQARQELAALRKDKRDFLVDYFNTKHHGPDWRDIEG